MSNFYAWLWGGPVVGLGGRLHSAAHACGFLKHGLQSLTGRTLATDTGGKRLAVRSERDGAAAPVRSYDPSHQRSSVPGCLETPLRRSTCMQTNAGLTWKTILATSPDTRTSPANRHKRIMSVAPLYAQAHHRRSFHKQRGNK